jgi:putative ABC transport system permease protein
MMNGVRQDLRYALRGWRRQPGFVLLVVLTLASAIGVNASLFSVFNTAIFRLGLLREADRVMHVRNLGRPVGVSIAEWRHLSTESESLRGLVAMPWARKGTLDGREARIQFVSAGFFGVLEAPMAAGRGFLPHDDAPDAPGNVAVLSEGAWRSRFASDPGVIGRTIHLDDLPFTVVGVTAFTGFSARMPQVWVPLTAQAFWEPDRSRDYLTNPRRCCAELVVRLAPGTGAATTRAEVERASAAFRTSLGLAAERFEVAPAGSVRSRARRLVTRGGFGLLFIAVTLVLLLACANVGNLLLARAYARRTEIAVRLSLGAGRARIVRQLLTEAFALAAAAGVLGLAIAQVLPKLVLHGVGEAEGLSFPTDHRVLLYALTLATLACVVAGLAPALQGTREAMGATLKAPQTAPVHRTRLRSALLAAQVAIAMVLLVGAGLLTRGIETALDQDLGFSMDDVQVVSFEAPRALSASSASAFTMQLVTQVEALAGPDRTAVTPMIPMELGHGPFRLPEDAPTRTRVSATQTVSSGYFELLRIPIVTGRAFAPGDDPERVAVVNETFARSVWPDGTPLGRRIDWRGAEHEVIGVVRDARLGSWESVEPTIFGMAGPIGVPRVLVRDTGDGLAQAVVATAAHIDPRLRASVASLSGQYDQRLNMSRLGARTAGGVGLLALALATLGLFGVFAYSVQQRTREIGVRIALGARAVDIFGIVLSTASRALLIGLAVGVAGAVAGARLLRHLLYGLSPFDPATYLGVGVVLVAVGALATWLPTRRALRVDPTVALRYE